ncbi:MAG: MFS transporter [Luteolibacter sp.]
MEQTQQRKGIFARLWLLSFFHGMAPGFWVPALTNLLKSEGLASWVPLAFAIPPVCAIFSPLIGGALADERMPAQKVMAWSSFLGAIALLFAFGALDAGLGPLWFIAGLSLYAFSAGPTWGLLATISLTHLGENRRGYPLVRMGATFGWMAAGFLTSYVLNADSSPIAGYASAGARVAAGCLALIIPHTPPLGSGKSWKAALGLGAFSLFKNRDHAVLFTVTGLFSIPLAAFYMYSPELLEILGDKTPTATMTIAQWTEVAAMISLGFLMGKCRLKTLLMWGLGLSALRFSMSGFAGLTGAIGWHISGIALHGVCYTFYFVTAQVYLDQRIEPTKRGQAQGLLALMSSGLGALAGSFFCGWLRTACVDEHGNGWQTFWWILAGIIAACWVAIGILYRGKAPKVSRIPAA